MVRVAPSNISFQKLGDWVQLIGVCALVLAKAVIFMSSILNYHYPFGRISSKCAMFKKHPNYILLPSVNQCSRRDLKSVILILVW